LNIVMGVKYTEEREKKRKERNNYEARKDERTPRRSEKRVECL
jgi:hypothetical protein